MSLTLPSERQQRLEIVTHYLGQLVDVYQKLRPTIDNFVDVMRKIKEKVMRPDKWEVVK